MGWWAGGQVGRSEKNEINAILNSVEVEVCVEFDKISQGLAFAF